MVNTVHFNTSLLLSKDYFKQCKPSARLPAHGPNRDPQCHLCLTADLHGHPVGECNCHHRVYPTSEKAGETIIRAVIIIIYCLFIPVCLPIVNITLYIYVYIVVLYYFIDMFVFCLVVTIIVSFAYS